MADLEDYWSGLLAFEQAAEHLSFTQAARQLGLTPSAVSKAVARLEKRLGARLFYRSTRSTSLTTEGRDFYEHIAPLLRGLRDAEAVVQSVDRVAGQVRVSAPIDLGRMLIAAWSADFAAAHPSLGLMLNVTDRLVDLWREGYDVAIRIGKDGGGNAIRLGTLDYAIVVSPDFLKRNGYPNAPEDIPIGDRLCYLTVDGQKMPWTLDTGRAIAAGDRLQTDDGGALRSAVLGGAGVAYLFRFAVDADLKSGALVELFRDLPKTRLPVWALHPFSAGMPRRVEAFLDFAKQKLT